MTDSKSKSNISCTNYFISSIEAEFIKGERGKEKNRKKNELNCLNQSHTNKKFIFL